MRSRISSSLVRGSRRCFERAGEAAQQVGAAEDANQNLVVEHRDPLDAVALHQLHDLFERSCPA